MEKQMNQTAPLWDTLDENEIVSELTFSVLQLELLDMPNGLHAPAPVQRHIPFGNMLPLIVVPTSGGRYLVVDGCKRLERLMSAHKTECACGVLKEGTDPKRALLLRILLNSERALSVSEKVRFVGWLRENLPPSDYARVMERLGIEPRERHEIEGLTTCAPEVINAVVDGCLVGAVALDLGRLCSVDRRAVLDLFRELSLSRQMQREFVEWIADIIIRDRLCASDLLNGGEIGRVRSDLRLNAPQKIQKTREAIHQRRFPSYGSMLRNWRIAAAKLNPDPSRITLVPSEFFEKDRLEIRLSVGSAAQAHTLLCSLAAIPENDWGALVSPAGSASLPDTDKRQEEASENSDLD